jgi:hypothetical protein
MYGWQFGRRDRILRSQMKLAGVCHGLQADITP